MERLNVGCGRSIMEGWINLDVIPAPGIDILFDLNAIPGTQIPLQSDSIDCILMSHILEHLPAPMDVMQELYRIAKPGAVIMVRAPHGANDEAWIDPTHVRPYFPRSFTYFGQPKFYQFDYGYKGDWDCSLVVLCSPFAEQARNNIEGLLSAIDTQRNLCSELIAYLKAIKPSRERRREFMTQPKVVVAKAVQPGFVAPDEFLRPTS